MVFEEIALEKSFVLCCFGVKEDVRDFIFFVIFECILFYNIYVS